jgi:hypothetical protein
MESARSKSMGRTAKSKGANSKSMGRSSKSKSMGRSSKSKSMGRSSKNKSMKNRSAKSMKCNDIELSSKNDIKHMFNKLLDVMENGKINMTGRAMIENELKTNKKYSFLFGKKSIFDIDKLLDLASKFIYVPEKSDRVEELSGGGYFLINYDKANFKYDVLSIITFIISIVLLYISYLRFNDLYETLNAAELRSMMPKGMFDGRISLVLEHFVSILPGCNEGNMQSRFLTGITQIVKEKVFDTLSASTEKAKLTCFTQISNDPNSMIQYVSSGFESLFDSSISTCVTNTLANDFSVMLNQLTLNMNNEFGKVKGTVNMIFYAGGCLFNSMRHLNYRMRMKNASPKLAITEGGTKKLKTDDPNNVFGSLALGIGIDESLFGGKKDKK